MWNGAFSEIISVKNGVKQGGILSPILFCVYLDNLILSLVNSGVGCHMGHICLSVLAYADDVVILAPTASAMRKLLAICDGFANDFDVKFNAYKTKCILFQPSCCNKMSCNAKPVFSIQDNIIEFVESWPHLGHIINNKLNDCDDIIDRRNILLGQINDLLCNFGKLNPVIKTNLLYSYCSNLYGCELWDLTSIQLPAIGVAWRKALKRVWSLPLGTHAHILYSLCGKWSVEDEICRRNIMFAFNCFNSTCNVIHEVCNMLMDVSPASSLLCRNVLYFCNHYSVTNFHLFNSYNFILRNKVNFMRLCHEDCRPANMISADHLNLLLECIFLRDGVFNLDEHFDDLKGTMTAIILFICTG